jgi:hypothetical protein
MVHHCDVHVVQLEDVAASTQPCLVCCAVGQYLDDLMLATRANETIAQGEPKPILGIERHRDNKHLGGAVGMAARGWRNG